MLNLLASIIENVMVFSLVTTIIVFEGAMKLFYIGFVIIAKLGLLSSIHINSYLDTITEKHLYVLVILALNVFVPYAVYHYLFKGSTVATNNVIDLTESDNDEEKDEKDEKEEKEEDNNEQSEESDDEEETNDEFYLMEKGVIHYEDYNQLLFDSAIDIWKTGDKKWYYKKNEHNIKYIIAQLLPVELKESNELFLQYKGKFITTIPDDIRNELIIARNNNPYIYKLIDRVYKKIKNSYKY